MATVYACEAGSQEGRVHGYLPTYAPQLLAPSVVAVSYSRPHDLLMPLATANGSSRSRVAGIGRDGCLGSLWPKHSRRMGIHGKPNTMNTHVTCTFSRFPSSRYVSNFLSRNLQIEFSRSFADMIRSAIFRKLEPIVPVMTDQSAFFFPIETNHL